MGGMKPETRKNGGSVFSPAPAEIIRQRGTGDALEAEHPALHPAVIGVDVVQREKCLGSSFEEGAARPVEPPSEALPGEPRQY